MTSTVLLRTIYGIAIAGLLIAGGYLLGFQFLWRQCPPDSHWVTYSGEEISEENFFGPETEDLDWVAPLMLASGMPSLYEQSAADGSHTIRMTILSLAHGVAPSTALTITEAGEGQFKANLRWILAVRDPSKKTSGRILHMNEIKAKRLRDHLNAENAWYGCKDFNFRDNPYHATIFLIEQSKAGRYRMLVQEVGPVYDGEPQYGPHVTGKWVAQSYKLFRELAGENPHSI